MSASLKTRVLIIIGLTLLCVFGLFGLPKFPPTSWDELTGNFENRIKLGLDLRGGTQLVLQVQVEDAVNLECDRTVDRLTDLLRDPANNIPFDEVRKLDSTHILIRNIPSERVGDLRNLVADNFPGWDLGPAAGEANGYTLAMRATVAAQIRQDTMRQSIETIRRRVDALGLTEPVIAEHGRGENEILIQLPGEGDPARAKAVIQAGGQLELRLVRGGPFRTQAEALAQYGGVLPVGTELVRGRGERTRPGETPPADVWWLLNRSPVVTGRDLRTATVGPAPRSPGRYAVNFTLSRDGAARFGPFTEANVGQRLAVVLEGQVYNAPVINSRIDDQGLIEEFSRQEAEDLALVLRAGALPASIRYLEERVVGPSLGADSIRQGFFASVVSLLIVMVLMLLYYKQAGINASVALVLNLLLLLAALAYLGAVLTLPGIAGVILTIGMAVDSNVLVFERIREELELGKAPASAVDTGFSRAFLTIVDTHVTTIVSCLFLFLFGTGPIRGFAITLTIGLVANVVTAIYVSRTIFLWHLARAPREAELSI
jgi:preprotein translocase subunit SecD